MCGWQTPRQDGCPRKDAPCTWQQSQHPWPTQEGATISSRTWMTNVLPAMSPHLSALSSSLIAKTVPRPVAASRPREPWSQTGCRTEASGRGLGWRLKGPEREQGTGAPMGTSSSALLFSWLVLSLATEETRKRASMVTASYPLFVNWLALSLAEGGSHQVAVGDMGGGQHDQPGCAGHSRQANTAYPKLGVASLAHLAGDNAWGEASKLGILIEDLHQTGRHAHRQRMSGFAMTHAAYGIWYFGTQYNSTHQDS